MTRAHPFDEPSSEAGFTLVEMLVGLVLTSLLATMLLGATHYGLAIRERTTLRAAAADKVVAVQDFLRNSLSLAYPLFVGESNGTGKLDFEGGPTSVRFVAPAAQAGGLGGRSSFTIALSQSNPPALVVNVGDAATNDRKDVLLSDITGLAFSYLPKAAFGEARWVDHWDQGIALPVAVRVNVQFPPGDQRVWPELLIALRIDVDAACVLDDLTKRCRGR